MENTIYNAPKGVQISEYLKEQIENSDYTVMGAKVNNEYKGLDYVLEEDSKIELLKINTKEGTRIYRTTLAFIMGKAFWRTYPDAHVVVDYQLSNSMYCTIENMEVTTEMLEKVKEEDLVVLPGDFSWAMYLEEIYKFPETYNNPARLNQEDTASLKWGQ